MIRKPNFERLRRTLYCKKSDAVPLVELYHDIEVMDYFMGREVNTTEDRIEFYKQAGYDYFPVKCKKWFTGVKSSEEETEVSRKLRTRRKERKSFSNSETNENIISSLADFHRYDWSLHSWLKGGGDLSYLDQVSRLIPEEMKIIAWSDGIFEFFSNFIGYECFCFALNDDISFIEEVFNEVGRRAAEAFDRVASHPAVGAIWLADDIGFTEGLLWSPILMRKYLFPWYKKIGESAKKYNKPFIFHSDGRLWDVIPDLLDAGINALQPIEPKSWNPVEIKRRYGDKLCILGTIDLDLICRGTIDEVIEMTKDHIDLFRKEGGFAVGTSNTPTYYMNQENYKAVLKTTLEYGKL